MASVAISLYFSQSVIISPIRRFYAFPHGIHPPDPPKSILEAPSAKNQSLFRGGGSKFEPESSSTTIPALFHRLRRSAPYALDSSIIASGSQPPEGGPDPPEF